MHRGLFSTAIAAVMLAVAGACVASPATATPQGAALLHQDKPMTFGAYYYPMQWPEKDWARDLRGIARLGFDFTHMAEFDWTYMEPEEGTFDFAWLDHAIELAHENGLRVILGTPTPAPPSWMNKYPQVYRVDEDGRRHQFGIRAEVSLADPTYRKFVRRIVTEMAKRYGDDPRVWGWQVDNEPNTFADYSDSARQAFQQWLRDRYGSVEALNKAWGASFWSSRYRHFDEVLIPNVSLAGEDALSPQALLDFARYQADTTARFLDMQASIIKTYARHGQWVTTNYTNVTRASDPRRTRQLDLMSYTMYPVSGADALGGDNYAIGYPTTVMEASAYFRPIKGTFGVMEMQPGQVNWGSINPQPMPGAVNMWMWQVFATGGSFISTYRYRHPLAGSEMYHAALTTTDGVTLARTGKEYVDTVHEINAFQNKLDPGAKRPAALNARATGYLWKHDNFWDLEIQPQTRLWDSWAYRHTFTQIVKSTGAPMDFIAEDDDFSRYPFLIAPAYQIVGPELVRKWTRYVEQGGHLILTARSGQKNALAHFPDGPWAQPILDLIGADIQGFDAIPPSAEGKVKAAGKIWDWHRWADILVPRKGTEVLATYANHYYAGKAAATTRRLGKGTVTMIGVSTDDGQLERELVREVYRRAGVDILDLPAGVFASWRGGYHFMVNYNPEPFTPTLPAGAEIVHGETPLAPAHVLIWKESGR